MHSYITIGGSGTRLKGLSPKDKYLLFYRNHRIIDWIQKIIPDTHIVGREKTNNRKETLGLIPHRQDVLIIDCDIIPFGFSIDSIPTDSDCVVAFHSGKNKYGSIVVKNNKVISCSEKQSISTIKCSGIYFIKNLDETIEKMQDDNSIISGMINSSIVFENTFLRFGDIEDYLESIKNS